MSKYISNIHRGISRHRLKDNPLEKKIANKWEEENWRGGILAHLLDQRPVQGGSPPEPSDRDALVAATVIQWLGSPVGQHFLEELGFMPVGKKGS